MRTVNPPLDLTRRFPGFEDCATPQVVVDAAALTANIQAMQAIAECKVALHPHIKTHKSASIASMQRDAGAAGFTVARLNEAAMLLQNGLGPVTVAYPIIAQETAHAFLSLDSEPSSIRLIADSLAGVAAIAAASSALRRTTPVFMKVDVGLHRCGVDPDGEMAIAVAKAIAGNNSLHFAGLLSHAGHAYGTADPQAVRAAAQEELVLLARLRQRLEDAGVAVPDVSIGSTPTLLANAGFDGITEVRPGNYVFLDMTAVRLGIATRNDVSLGVAARIVSSNATYAIANVGSKTLSSDLGAHGSASTRSYGEVWTSGTSEPFSIERLSEEHAFIPLNGQSLPVGTPLLILPNHSCPVANLSGGLLFLGSAHGAERVSIDAQSNAVT